jgi:NADP-dependent 3-hydroxy acid dehydrogenase YdfG
MAQVFRSPIGGALRTISRRSPLAAAFRCSPQYRYNSSHATAPSLKPFAGKVITITGGARGIGLATARYLAARGATICISDVLEKDLEKAEEGIFKDFPDVSVRKAVVDVSKSEEVNKWIKDVKFEFGELNGCVNNAGMFSHFS